MISKATAEHSSTTITKIATRHRQKRAQQRGPCGVRCELWGDLKQSTKATSSGCVG